MQGSMNEMTKRQRKKIQTLNVEKDEDESEKKNEMNIPYLTF